MVDNSWIDSDRRKPVGDTHSKMMSMKVMLTVAIILIGCIVTVVVHSVGSDSSAYQAEGILIDVGDYKTYWTDIRYSENTDDPKELLEIACGLKGYSCVFTDGKLTSVTVEGIEYSNNSLKTWDLWYVEKNGYDYSKSDTYSIRCGNYTVVTWAYMGSDEVPTVAVDATANCIYGYNKPSYTVTLSPVCSELVGAMKATSTIIGTDESSNYPTAIKTGKANKTISVVGTYTDPSYESIMSLSPDMVFCDGSQLSHKEMANSLRNSSVNAVVVYNGNDFDCIIKNIFIVGAAMGYELRAIDVIHEIEESFETLETMTASHQGSTVMITLGSNPSPYVAASNTYVNDIVMSMNGYNVFSYLNGWPQIISEYIQMKDPECIIVLDEGRYKQDEYDLMMATLSSEWKNTEAYKNGNVYMFCDSVADMAQRYGPRTIQLVELFARIINPDSFDDGITVPKSIGNDYQDYLTITKDQGYDL